MIGEFQNQSLINFAIDEERRKMTDALMKVESSFGGTHDLIIGGEHVKAQKTFPSINPSNKDQVVGYFQMAEDSHAARAVDVASRTFETWRWFPARERADLLFQIAAIMRRRRYELSAMMVLEVGKSWVEADADVAEAIDFHEFYGREMIRLSQDQPLTSFAGEDNELKYIPIGPVVVIPPWNFPLAITVGMTSAAFVTGNTVILKPSSDAPAIAYMYMEILREAGCPPGVVNYISGPGRLAGEALVGNPRTRAVCFTGSKEVGLRINETASKTARGQMWIKRIIAEMGGKDTIIVDKECDLEAAAQNVVSSAFGFQGQKCSACSRLIAHESIYETLLEKIVEKTKRITVGPTKDVNNYMGPVINEKAYESILGYIDTGKNEGRLACGGEAAQGNGFFIYPTVVADVEPTARISLEEIFGPVLAVIKARNFDHALEIANNTEYGLTGSIYSHNVENIRKGKRIFHVGNLYINRKCTGALVGVHPFGGFNMSGTDSKAGGRDYLLLFTQAKAISHKFI